MKNFAEKCCGVPVDSLLKFGPKSAFRFSICKYLFDLHLKKNLFLKYDQINSGTVDCDRFFK